MSSVGSSSRRVNLWKGLAAVVGVGALALAAAPMATADDFEPGNSAPVVASVDGDLDVIQPNYTTGTNTYTVAATVSDADTLQDLDDVVMCLYQDSLDGGTDAECDTTDEQDAIAITWSGDDTFAVTDGTGVYFVDATSTDDYSAAATSMTVTFNFKVSPAMQEDTDWNVRVTATDNSAAEGYDEDSTVIVNHYAQIDSARGAQSFGTIASGATTEKNNIFSMVMSNGGYDINMSTTTFVGADTSTVATPDNGAVAAGISATEVAFDCVGGSSYTDVGALRVTTSGADVPNMTALVPGVGLAEGGTSAAHSCAIESGGQLPIENYDATVAFTVTAD